MVKYPLPDEAASRYVSGVELAKEKWVTRCREGSEAFQTWFAGFAKAVYPLVATLPDKTGDPEKNVDLRVKPVAKKIHELAKAYRKTKISAKAERIAVVVR